MAKGPIAVEIEGMKEVRKSLKEFSSDNGWRAPLREVYRGVASMTESASRATAGESRTNLAGGVARLGGQGVASIKGKGTTTGATLSGLKGIPWGAGSNFGSGGAFRQFPSKASPDYFLYKTIEEKRDEIVEQFAREIDAALDREF
jgi:hypothetical protein